MKYGEFDNLSKEELIEEIVRLRENQARDLSIVNDALHSSVSAVVISDLKDRITYVNPAFINMFDYNNEEEVFGKKAARLFATKRVKKFSDVEEIIGDSEDIDEFPVRQKNGNIITVEVSSSVVTDQQGKVVGRMASLVDISKRKEAEADLRKAKDELERIVEERTKELSESEEKFRVLSEKSLIGIFIDQSDGLKYINPSFARIFGYDYRVDRNSLLDKTLKDFIFIEDWEKIANVNRKLMSGEITSTYYQFRGRKKNGSTTVLDVYKSLITYRGTKAVIGSIIDITERKKTEQELKRKSEELETLNKTLEKRIRKEIEKHREQEQLLIQQSKLAAMGEMVGAISHQWRQPISTVSLILENIEESYEYGDLTREFLKESVKKGVEQIQYMSKTIDDFRNFFKPTQDKTNFSIKNAVEETLSIIRAQMDSHLIEILFTPELEDDGKISGYPNEFKQVLINIINNAKDAILERRENDLNLKGKIRIKVFTDHHKVIITIRDNGGGIPIEVLDRIFEPYFTTKEQGKGVGIGLYMSKRIIDNNMKGSLFASNIDDGALLTIKLRQVKEEFSENGQD